MKLKYFLTKVCATITIFFHCAVLQSVSIPGCLPFGENYSWMPDVQLVQAVRRELKIPDGTLLLQTDMKRLHRLTSIDEGIVLLKGLELATNLQYLHLKGGSIRDLTPLARLTNLQVLILDDNDISNISPLSELTNLQVLSLNYNNIKSLEPVGLTTKYLLDKLINLNSLSLKGNQIHFFGELLVLSQLEHLYVYPNPGAPEGKGKFPSDILLIEELSAIAVDYHICDDKLSNLADLDGDGDVDRTDRYRFLSTSDFQICYDTHKENRSTADVNRDGVVNILDLVATANAFGSDAPDLNGDGVVNILDLVFISNQLGN